MLLFVNYGEANELKVIIDLDSSRSPIISDDKGKGTASVALDSSFSLSKSQDVKVTEVRSLKKKMQIKSLHIKKVEMTVPMSF